MKKEKKLKLLTEKIKSNGVQIRTLGEGLPCGKDIVFNNEVYIKAIDTK